MQIDDRSIVPKLRKATGGPVHTHSTEDLLQYSQPPAAGGSSQKLDGAVMAWRSVLGELRVPHTANRVRSCLAPFVGTYTPSSQRSTIHNYDEVVAALRRKPPDQGPSVAKFLRFSHWPPPPPAFQPGKIVS
jgi:hypothetical protein